jgi:hypothetical protein
MEYYLLSGQHVKTTVGLIQAVKAEAALTSSDDFF